MATDLFVITASCAVPSCHSTSLDSHTLGVVRSCLQTPSAGGRLKLKTTWALKSP